MKFKVRNWAVELKKYSRNGEVYYGGWIDYEGKAGLCGTGYTGNRFTLYAHGRIFYDWPETIPKYLQEAILKRCKF